MSRTRQTEEQQRGKQIEPNEQGNKYKGNDHKKPMKKRKGY